MTLNLINVVSYPYFTWKETSGQMRTLQDKRFEIIMKETLNKIECFLHGAVISPSLSLKQTEYLPESMQEGLIRL